MKASIGCRSIVKFFENTNKESKNYIITKTLCKLGVVDKEWLKGTKEEKPSNNQFWLVEIINETCPGRKSGCFILKPVKRIDMKADEEGSLKPDTLYLLPGMYKEAVINGLNLIYPNESETSNWMLPLNFKASIQSSKDVYAIIVDLRSVEDRPVLDKITKEASGVIRGS